MQKESADHMTERKEKPCIESVPNMFLSVSGLKAIGYKTKEIVEGVVTDSGTQQPTGHCA